MPYLQKAFPFGSDDVPVENGIVPPETEDVPSGNGDVPVESGIVPLKLDDVPVENGIVPPETGDVPSGNGDVPVENGIVPSEAGDVPFGGEDVRLEDGCVCRRLSVLFGESFVMLDWLRRFLLVHCDAMPMALRCCVLTVGLLYLPSRWVLCDETAVFAYFGWRYGVDKEQVMVWVRHFNGNVKCANERGVWIWA